MLSIVPTPIGNLSDITLRAIETLKAADLILAEDTRKTGVLLKHYEIGTPMKSYHSFNEHKIVGSIMEQIAQGKSIALVSDAGTPGISDPGFLLIREVQKNGLELEVLPGPTAFVPALLKSGLPNDRFTFEGFLPHKKGKMKKLLSLKEEERTMVFYESPHRILKTLSQMIEVFGSGRQVSVSRELTKMYEETHNGSLEEVRGKLEGGTIKGEFVITLAGFEVDKNHSSD